ncbi:malto-oligosyltrehalose synthase [Microbaculum marinum]|uniref:Malto-oligosyltrehalose synthase n=1 Tax=Microbaculum marinum TaxID=1764581 RepID=A0AAW9RV83_9HYPH
MKPTATYRLQFRNGMTFDRAVGILPYLKRLGISHLYASPVFTATSGSTHGYDVTDCNELDPAIGGREGFERLSRALKDHGLGLILDIVPNHMAASLENPWWRSVVQWGEDSPFARHFDIDWSKRLTLPLLGGPFSQVLAAGELSLRLDRDNGCLALAYYDHAIPLDPRTWPNVLDVMGDAGPEEVLRGLAAGAGPSDAEPLREHVRNLGDDTAAAFAGRLAELSREPAVLEALHDSQPWQLTDWREARRHLSYRRFFEVTGLVGLRVEDEEVYRDAHGLILDLVRSGQVDGLRVDHIDGLADPTSYLRRLRADVGADTYLVVEKILEGDETLPADWPIDGTTGYEFITAIGALLTDERQAEALQDAYSDCRGGRADLEEERRAAKQTMLRVNFEGEVSNLVTLLRGMMGEHDQPAVSADQIRDAICAVIVAFPVYRTYATSEGMSAADRTVLEEAVAEARRFEPSIPGQAFDALLDAMNDTPTAPRRHSHGTFLARFQQLTGPVMAKAVEDTLFYRFNRNLAVNEVGGDPADVEIGPETFHSRMALRVAAQPYGLLATSTHDTKRGEDARARLYAISEAPGQWAEAVARWRARHAPLVTKLPVGPAPEPDTEWLVYQALAGVWPADIDAREGWLDDLRDRFAGYLEKALREAKLRTNWTDVDAGYEGAVQAYAAALLNGDNAEFLEDFAMGIRPFVAAGAVNSLAQTVIKLSAPGIPDVYQGAESFDLSLVDPDNRRPIDFAGLDRSLDDPAEDSGSRLKQHVLARGLSLRSQHPDLFTKGDYRPLQAKGSRQRHVVAFERRHGDDRAVAVVPRLPFALLQSGRSLSDAEVWGDTVLELSDLRPGERFVDIFSENDARSGEELSVARLFSRHPFAILLNRPGSQAR